MIILRGTILVLHTIIFPGQETDFLSLITVSMLRMSENANFNMVESMADKFSNYVPNTVVKDL
jgi:hypothetical protein